MKALNANISGRQAFLLYLRFLFGLLIAADERPTNTVGVRIKILVIGKSTATNFQPEDEKSRTGGYALSSRGGGELGPCWSC